jgi:hypothetical protein
MFSMKVSFRSGSLLLVAANIGFNYSLKWPDKFENVMSALSVFSLDMLPSLGLNCYTAGFDYINKSAWLFSLKWF